MPDLYFSAVRNEIVPGHASLTWGDALGDGFELLSSQEQNLMAQTAEALMDRMVDAVHRDGCAVRSGTSMITLMA